MLIIAAGLLAFVVLYNLTNINIGERQRETATLKVLGFYDKETYSYIFRETVILSIIGALLACEPFKIGRCSKSAPSKERVTPRSIRIRPFRGKGEGNEGREGWRGIPSSVSFTPPARMPA